jgi:DNA helicase IV
MNFANRLLPVAAPNVEATHSVRSEGDDPVLVRTSPAALADEAVAVANAMAERMTTVGVIVPESVYDAMAETLSASGSDWHAEELGGKLTLLHPAAVKGLEFDGVVLVEPTRIFEEELHGPRMLYITLTRAVQELAIVFSDALPEELAPAPAAVG